MNRTPGKAQNGATTNQDTGENRVLDRNVNMALRGLVGISKKLVMLVENETQALVRGDMLRFACVQQDKESLAEQYAQASEEFRSRLEEFRFGDKALIAQLERLQDELKQKTESNNVMIAHIKKRAREKTQSTLFTAQELAQRGAIVDLNPQQQATGANQ